MKALQTSHEGAGGRPRLDKGDDSWKQKFYEAYLKCNGNYGKAAAVTPYSVRQIREFLSPGSSSYDEDFFKEVDALDLTLAGDVQESFIGLLSDERNWEKLETAKIAQTKGWVQSKILSALDAKWGRRSEVVVKGQVEHKHSVDYKPREQVLAELDDDRKKFFARMRDERKALPQATSTAVELPVAPELVPIEAEVVEDV